MTIENDDQNVEAANDRAIEEMRAKVRAPEAEKPEKVERKPAPEDDEEDEELSLDDDEEEGDDEAEPAEQLTRKERRRNRLREVQEKARAAEERAEAAERAYQAMLEAQEQQRTAEPVQHEHPAQRDYDAEYKAKWDEQQRVADYANMLNEKYERQGQRMPKEEYDQLLAYAQRLEQDRQRIQYERFHAEKQPQQRQQPAPVVHPVVRAMHAEFPDVFTDPLAKEQVKINYKRALREGKPDNPDTLRAAVIEARHQHLGVKPPAPKPTANAKAKFTGSGSGGQAGQRGADAPKNVVMMTKEMKRMADAAYPHIEDNAKRWKTWAKTAGVKSMEDATKERRRA
jgi:hypothetical protein